MTTEELEQAVDAAVALGAEQARTTDASGYTYPAPDWVYDALDAALPEHLGYGYVEGVLLQRGPRTTGGYRVATVEERLVDWVCPGSAYVSIPKVLPALVRARVRRLLLEAWDARGGPAEEGLPVRPARS